MSTVVSDNAGPSSHATPTTVTFGNPTSEQQPDRKDIVSSVGQGMATKAEERGVTVCPVDDEAVVPGKGGGREHATQQQQEEQQRRTALSDSRSLDYILRSGLAGGLAGCAVC